MSSLKIKRDTIVRFLQGCSLYMCNTLQLNTEHVLMNKVVHSSYFNYIKMLILDRELKLISLTQPERR